MVRYITQTRGINHHPRIKGNDASIVGAERVDVHLGKPRQSTDHFGYAEQRLDNSGVVNRGNVPINF